MIIQHDKPQHPPGILIVVLILMLLAELGIGRGFFWIL